MGKKTTEKDIAVEDPKVNERNNTTRPTETTNDKCFIITQIGNTGSDIRRHTDGVIHSIREALKSFNIDVSASHEDSGMGSISINLVERILSDKLVIANLTGLNPNVMYELAVRHAAAKPVVTIAEKGTELPFDLSHERTIFYYNDIYGFAELQNEIKNAYIAIESENSHTDNPIYRAQSNFNLKKVEDSGAEPIISRQMSDIMRSINTLNSKLNLLQQENGTMIDFHLAVRELNTNPGEANMFLRNLGIVFDGRYISTQMYLLLKDQFGARNSLRGNIR